jgi:hypothetical protein
MKMPRIAMRPLLAMALIAAAPVLPGQVENGQADSGQVDVKVTDGIGDPLTGATVAVGKNGNYSLPELVDLSGVATFELPPGNYDAQIVLSGYAPKIRPFEIATGQTAKLHVAFAGAEKEK